MQLQNELKNLAGQAKKKKGVLAIYLFGSVARGHPNAKSDIDICIIPEKEKLGMDSIIEMFGTASPSIDLVNFYRLPIQMRYRVFKEGKSIYEKDRGLVSRIISKTISEYLDMKPGLERIYKAILKGKRKHG